MCQMPNTLTLIQQLHVKVSKTCLKCFYPNQLLLCSPRCNAVYHLTGGGCTGMSPACRSAARVIRKGLGALSSLHYRSVAAECVARVKSMPLLQWRAQCVCGNVCGHHLSAEASTNQRMRYTSLELCCCRHLLLLFTFKLAAHRCPLSWMSDSLNACQLGSDGIDILPLVGARAMCRLGYGSLLAICTQAQQQQPCLQAAVCDSAASASAVAVQVDNKEASGDCWVCRMCCGWVMVSLMVKASVTEGN